MRLNTKHLNGFILKKELDPIREEIKEAHDMLEKGTGPGSSFLGWLHLPSTTSKDYLKEIKNIAKDVRGSCDVFIVVGIGGSYLGSRAAMDFFGANNRDGSTPEILFAGNSIDPDYLSNLISNIKDKEICINVISKSGTTIEPASAFRILKSLMKTRYTDSEIKKRIICTTTKGKGALFTMAKKNGYKSLYIPEDVGGRFSVLTAVGLLPMAVAGIDIDEVIRGAADIEKKSSATDIDKNISYKYAALRNLLYRNGKKIEIGCSFHVSLLSMLEWWKQLFAESEGKEGKGLFPQAAIFSTDLHANGQLIQQGERNLFETFIRIKKKSADLKLPREEEDTDKLNYIAGKGLSFINKMAYEGTAQAHADGGAPNMALIIDERSAFCLGQLFYFFQRAVGLSGYLLRVNPFDQPGVQAYKENMFRLLGRP